MNNLAAITQVSADATPSQLLPHITWAEKAKWEYSTYLEAVFVVQGTQLPPWVYNIYKLGRYAVASRAMCQLATEYPALFCPMRIESVQPPAKLVFSIPSAERPLSQVLRRVYGDRDDEVATRLGSVWSVSDPEVRFSKACRLHLAVHAEMQLIGFYDENTELTPSFRFIGVSKKSCFLCQRFLLSHPSSFTVSSCHQKLYLSWRPPPLARPKTYKSYKSIMTSLCKLMESTARRDLQNRLGSYRSIPLDSTAGVSLTGLTNYNLVTPEGVAVTSSEPPSPYVSDSEEDDMAGASLRTDSTIFADNDVAPRPMRTLGGDERPSPPLVFNVVRADNVDRRDLVSLRDVEDATHKPSWGVFVKILNDSDDFGVCYNAQKEFLTVNDVLRVGNERQFHACLQFLRNSDCHNANVIVRTYASLEHKTVTPRSD